MESFFSSHAINPPNEDEFELTFFGPGFGESIVLHIPGIGWGVVDSCIFRIDKETFVPPLEYLNFLKIENLAFIALTHPHEDHYKGMDDIIYHYLGRIDRVCRYAGEGVRELKVYLQNRGVKGTPGIASLASVFKAFKKAQEHGSDPRRLAAKTQIIPRQSVIINNKSLEVEALSLSPLPEDEELYVNILRGALPELNKPFQEILEREHNLISSAIWISFGELKVILASDVEKGRNSRSGWRGIVLSVDSPDLSVQALKVAHHGSVDAYYQKAWNQYCKLGKVTSILTPFIKATQPIPAQEDFDRISNHSKYIGLTGHISYLRPVEVYDRATARRLPKKWKVVAPPRECGMITIRYNLHGTETSCRAFPPAKWIKKPT